MLYRVFDGHCDTPVELWLQEKQLRSSDLAVSLDKAAGLGGYAQFFAFCTAWIKTRMPHTEHFSRALDYFLAQLRKNEDRITLCRTAPEAEAAMQAGKCAAFLAIEGAEAVREDEGLLELFFRRAQKLGMLVDVSHLSEKGFWDMAELAEKPIVASHSDSFAVCPHPRNLTDSQFRAICDLGGTAGLNLYGPFLTDGPRVTFDDLRRHLDHFLDLGGEGHLALGADLDGCSVLPEGFAALNDYETLGRYLADAGYPDETIQNLFCNSLMKVVKTCIM